MTTPKWAPISLEPGKSFRTSVGVAEVAMSKSLGVRPRSLSRTQPPAK